MIYCLTKIEIAKENMETFWKMIRDEEAPTREKKYGIKLVGEWECVTGIICPTTIIHVWAYPDMATRQRFFEVRSKDEDLLKIRRNRPGLLLREERIRLWCLCQLPHCNSLCEDTGKRGMPGATAHHSQHCKRP